MPSNDSRFYPRISAASSTTITCPQAVLDQFKPIKTPAVDEETPAVYYVEADGLTIHEAALAAGIPVAYFDESQGGKPVQVETIEEAATVLYVLPPMLPTAMEPFFALARAQGSNPNHTLLFANYSYETWLQTGELPN